MLCNKIVDYNTIISLKNIHDAWREFSTGKKYKKDLSLFSLNLSHHVYRLHEDLKNKTYNHGLYESFSINDPKPRKIHKACVRDRLLHHAVYRVLYPYFDRKFIFDSYSCRNNKGTHCAINRFREFARKVSKNHRRTCWVLKCDIRKFFASVDQEILITILRKHISDPDIISLIENVVGSFESTGKGKGLPLGNLTSQLLVNVYMNEFDQYVKHVLKQKYYIRYADDFVFMSDDREELEMLERKITHFLETKLKLSLHPDKVFIKTLASGVDFLGWVTFSDHRVLRTTTKRRMFKKLKAGNVRSTESFLGLLSHGNAQKLRARIMDFLA
jgi:RNA-directed DNA polymerase